MSKSEMRVVFASAKLEVRIGLHRVDGYQMDLVEIRQAGKRAVRFAKETAVADAMRLADSIEWGSGAAIYEAALNAR